MWKSVTKWCYEAREEPGCQIRKSRGIGASDLARRVNVSRQTIYAIEAGTYVPNTEVALHLARELEVTVDELFSLLLKAQRERPSRCWPKCSSEDVAGEGQPVRICQIGSRWVGVPVSASPYYMPEADGIVQRGGRAGGQAELGGFRKGRGRQKRLLLAGCDPGHAAAVRHGGEDQRRGDRLAPRHPANWRFAG